MAKEWAKKFYNSKAWAKCRDGYISLVFGLCERCNGVGKIVHHKVELTPGNISDPMIALSWDNMMLVCHDCHNREHHGGGESVTVDGVRFNEQGELIPMPPIGIKIEEDT